MVQKVFQNCHAKRLASIKVQVVDPIISITELIGKLKWYWYTSHKQSHKILEVNGLLHLKLHWIKKHTK